MHLKRVNFHPDRYPTREHYPFKLDLFHRTAGLDFRTPVTLFVGPASGLATGSLAGLGGITEASLGSRVTAEAAGLYSCLTTPPDSASLSRQPATLYDDVELDRFAIEQALADMAGELDQTAGEAATDRLFASLSG